MFPKKYLPGFHDADGVFHLNERLVKAVKKHKGQFVSYRCLPLESQLSLAVYMSVEGEAWEAPPKVLNAYSKASSRSEYSAVTTVVLPNCISHYVRAYGSVMFGFIPAMPIKTLIEWCMTDAELKKEYRTWEKYHADFMSKGKRYESIADPWPVILNSFDDECLSDGWNHFHHYAENQIKTCPAIFYPREFNA